MTDKPTKKVLLMIADISGYTEFMVSSDLEIEHSQHVITELIQSIIKQVQINYVGIRLKVLGILGSYRQAEDFGSGWKVARAIAGKE